MSSDDEDDFSLDSDSDIEVIPKKKQKIDKVASSKPKTVQNSIIERKSTNIKSNEVITHNNKENILNTSSIILDGPDITRGPDITTESAAKSLIMRYMKLQNRPYSLLQIFENLHKRIQKSTLERCLHALCENQDPSNRLICKEYGKAKIYYPDQSAFMTLSNHEMALIQSEIDRLSKEVEKKREEEKAMQMKISMLAAEPTDDELDSYDI
jgi:hypothetical protein